MDKYARALSCRRRRGIARNRSFISARRCDRAQVRRPGDGRGGLDQASRPVTWTTAFPLQRASHVPERCRVTGLLISRPSPSRGSARDRRPSAGGHGDDRDVAPPRPFRSRMRAVATNPSMPASGSPSGRGQRRLLEGLQHLESVHGDGQRGPHALRILRATSRFTGLSSARRTRGKQQGAPLALGRSVLPSPCAA